MHVGPSKESHQVASQRVSAHSDLSKFTNLLPHVSTKQLGDPVT